MPRGYVGGVVSATEATRRWREKNPDKVKEYNSRPRIRQYNPEAVKAWRAERNRDPEYRDKIRRQSNERARKVKEFISEFKLRAGCKDCGYKEHHAALDFDHVVGDKKFNVCFSKSIEQAKKEMEKCEVVCANCHRIRTYKRARR